MLLVPTQLTQYLLQPLLHTIIFLIEMAIAIRLIAKFKSYYATKPILTTMITNAVLGGIADTVAQTLTAIRTRAKALPTPNAGARSILSETILEMDDLNEKPKTVLPLSRSPPPPFDFERLTRFMAYGFLMAPVQFHWFAALSRWFPITKERGMMPALQRVAMDQLIFAPIGLGCFFTFMTVAEGGGRRAVTKKFQDVYVPALRANYFLWPAVQMLNFRVIPVQFQIPFVSTVGIAWTAYLSLTNSAEEE
jgi:Mpv17 / PMP22 family